MLTNFEGGEESFIQRQKRLTGEQTAQLAAPQTQTSSVASPTQQPTTPVTGAGKIPDPAPVPPPIPASQTPTTPDPFTSMGGGVFVNGGWVPKGHPLAAGAPAPAIPGGGGIAAPTTNGPQSQGPVQALNIGAAPAYQGTQFAQFQPPNQSMTTGLSNSLLGRMLENPHTMSPQVLAMLQEKNKEAAVLQEQQARTMAQQHAASRGTTNGGSLQGLLAEIAGMTGDNIIRGNRDLEIAKLDRDRQDELQALSMAEAIMGGQMSRATQGYGATLAGQSAQAGDNRAVSQNALDRILAQFGINLQTRESHRADEGLGLQGELGRGGLALDNQRLSMQGSQFDKGHGLDLMRFLESQRQFNNNLGYNYNQLEQNGQNQLLNYIMGMF